MPISTAGAAPEVARAVRRDLEAHYGPEWETYVELLADVRKIVYERVPDAEHQCEIIFTAIAESDVRERIAAGVPITAEDVFREFVFGEEPSPAAEKDARLAGGAGVAGCPTARASSSPAARAGSGSPPQWRTLAAVRTSRSWPAHPRGSSRRAPSLREAATSPDQRIIAVQADLSDAAAATSAIGQVLDAGVGPDVVVNSAGVINVGEFTQMTPEQFAGNIDSGFWSVVNPCRAIVPAMIERGRGHLVNVSSVAGFLGIYGYTSYSAVQVCGDGIHRGAALRTQARRREHVDRLSSRHRHARPGAREEHAPTRDRSDRRHDQGHPARVRSRRRS